MTADTAPRAPGRRNPRAKPGVNPITTYPAWCKRCGLCVAFCPKQVYDRGPRGEPIAARPEDCIRCHLCELRCPDFAVTVRDEEVTT